jgi:aspartate carbamoyltransferase catalytic subunit
MRHLLSAADLDRNQAVTLLDIASGMDSVNDREIKKLPTLRGRSIVNLFFEDSTRTRISFEIAEKRLSADVVNFMAKGSSVSKGESLKDTAQTLAAMGADAIVVRHHASGAAHALAHRGWINVPIINAGDGTHQHPTQALLDAFTIRKHFHAKGDLTKDLTGLRVLIVGHSSLSGGSQQHRTAADAWGRNRSRCARHSLPVYRFYTESLLRFGLGNRGFQAKRHHDAANSG